MQLERLPYCLGGAHWSVCEVGRLLNELARRYTERTDEEGTTQLVLPRNGIFYVRYAVDSFLNVAARAQDAVRPHINSIFSTSLPKSLSKCIDGIRKEKHDIPASISEAMLTYWVRSGEKLRMYRNLAQHHAVVCSEGTLRIRNGKEPEISLLLPGNPDEKSPEAWKFGKSAVLAYPFCHDAFLDLFRFVHDIMSVLVGYVGDTDTFSQVVSFRAPMGPVKLRTHPVPDAETLPRELAALRHELGHQSGPR